MESLADHPIIQMILSLVIGVIIGLEREYQGKPAGVRTFTLICLGSTIFTILSHRLGHPNSMDRVASNIVTGIGFLGAGVIFKEQDRVAGLTTAAAIWATSSLGMAIGQGDAVLAFVGAFLLLAVLFMFQYVERWISVHFHTRHYRLVYEDSSRAYTKLPMLFSQFNLRASRKKQTIHQNSLLSHWTVHGSLKNHEQLVQELMKNPELKELDF